MPPELNKEKLRELRDQLKEAITTLNTLLAGKKLSCGHTDDDHPDNYNYMAGEAERYGRTCKLGWPW